MANVLHNFNFPFSYVVEKNFRKTDYEDVHTALGEKASSASHDLEEQIQLSPIKKGFNKKNENRIASK